MRYEKLVIRSRSWGLEHGAPQKGTSSFGEKETEGLRRWNVMDKGRVMWDKTTELSNDWRWRSF